jgi:hypothetical protein
MIVRDDRILLHLQDARRIPIDPQEIYLAIRFANCCA